MNTATVLAAILLAAGIGSVWLATLGLLVAATPLDRLHFVGLAGVWGPALVALAVLVVHPADQLGLKACLLVAMNWCFGALLAHVQTSLAYRLEMNDRQPAPETADETP